VYTSSWFAAPQAASAPVNDLLMLQLIEDFAQFYRKLARVAENKMRLHLWYESEDSAAVSLFSDDVSVDDKEAIVNALQRDPFPGHQRRLASNQIPRFRDLSVAHFVTQHSLNLLQSLELPQEFLAAAIDRLAERADYNATRKTVCAVKVVNNCAERAVKLATDFIEVLTKNTKQRNLLYQVVE